MDIINNRQKLVNSILIIVVFVVFIIYLTGNKPLSTKKDTSTAEDKNIFPLVSDQHILGNENAKIIIVEYSDTECPFCKVFHTTLKKIVSKNDGKVAWIYKHYPIAQLHPKAFHEAEATECAWEQGSNLAFWRYTNRIYQRTESNNKLDIAELPKIAEEIGLDMDIFNSCLSSGKFANKIENSVSEAQSLKIEGTPTSLIMIDGKIVDVIQGAQPFDAIQEKIDALLQSN